MRQHQRGIFGLSIALSLLVWFGFAAAGLIAIRGFDLSRQHIGRDDQKALDAPVMSVCDSLPQPSGIFGAKKLAPADCALQLRTGLEAIGANAQLAKDFKKLDDQRQRCSDEVARLARIKQQLDAERAARKPGVDAKVAQIDIDKAELIVALGLPDPGGTCEQRLARRDAMWAKVRDARIRDFPPTTAPPKSDDVTIRGTK